MKKALICGVSGQDGSYLANFLLSKGYRTYGTSRKSETSNLQNLARLGIQERLTLESMSITHFDDVVKVVAKIQPDEIYNVAGISSVGPSLEQPLEAMQSIILGNLNLLESIRQTDKSIKYFSAGSGECYGDTNGATINELTSLKPRSPYGVAKAASFWQVANYRELYGLYSCSGILFNHESPLRQNHIVTKKIIVSVCKIAAGSQEKVHLGDLSIIRDWGWAPEYVEAMWLMLHQDKPEDLILATGESNSLQAFVEAAFAYFDLDWRDYVVMDPNLLRPTDVKIFKADTTKAKKKLGWSARYKMRDVVRLMIETEVAERGSRSLILTDRAKP